MNTLPKVILTISFFLFVLIAFIAIASYQKSQKAFPPAPLISPTPEPVSCTIEARICPDGSYVGRQGPKCEFQPCPTRNPLSSPTPTSNTCGGWDISGEIICSCSGTLTKPTCTPGEMCNLIEYTCDGTCTNCCYKGMGENLKYPRCKN